MDTNDHDAIRAIIDRQFGSLNWDPTTPANWSAFVGDFLPGASLYPAARPATRQKPEEFVERMKGLATRSCAHSRKLRWGMRFGSSEISPLPLLYAKSRRMRRKLLEALK
jgi:hypothetical protein